MSSLNLENKENQDVEKALNRLEISYNFLAESLDTSETDQDKSCIATEFKNLCSYLKEVAKLLGIEETGKFTNVDKDLIQKLSKMNNKIIELKNEIKDILES